MISSGRLGGRGTTAGSRVQIGSTAQAEPRTIFSAEQQSGRSRQGQLLPHDVTNIDVRRALQEGVEIGVVSRLGIGAEDSSVDFDIYISLDVGQTAATLTLHGSVQLSPPEVLPVAGRLQLPGYRYWPLKVQVQAFECRIVGSKLPYRAHRAALKIPDVNSQHSRLN